MLKSKLINITNHLVYHYLVENDWNKEYYNALEVFQNYNAPACFLTKLMQAREKVCYTFSAIVYTASATSSRRGESLNGVIKEHGDSK